MKDDSLLIIAALAIGAYFLYSKLGKPIVDAVEGTGNIVTGLENISPPQTIIGISEYPSWYNDVPKWTNDFIKNNQDDQAGLVRNINTFIKNNQDDQAGLIRNIKLGMDVNKNVLNSKTINPVQKIAVVPAVGIAAAIAGAVYGNKKTVSPTLKNAYQTVINPSTGNKISIPVTKSLHGYINPKTGFRYSGR
jgi:hypothetical protein